ncbi:hypothetical protein [Streptococcus pluranimalium]|uniref:hypothetical protein n=1 Tax=Streptococcus pluranimalium TaxID=82348 RepID=UPI003F692E96
MQLSEQTEKLIIDFADYAIEQSDTYANAILYIKKTASNTLYGQSIKNAIQDEITRRALNSKIIL